MPRRIGRPKALTGIAKINLSTGEMLRDVGRAPGDGAMLATAGDLVFHGDMSRRFRAFEPAACTGGPRGQRQTAEADWPMYNRGLAGTRYSPLTEINASNVSKLTQAWSYRLQPDGKTLTSPSPAEIFQEITPIVVKGVMYLPSGNRVVALPRRWWRPDIFPR